jgi:hypothetical protein
MSIFNKLTGLEARFFEIESKLADPHLANRSGEFKED